MKILWIPAGPLGDFITAVPMLRELRSLYPGATIESPIFPDDLALFALQQKLIDSRGFVANGHYDLFVNSRDDYPSHKSINATQRVAARIDPNSTQPVCDQIRKGVNPKAAPGSVPNLSVVKSPETPGLIALHPCANFKHWQGWQGMFRYLRQKGVGILLVCGPRDLGVAPRLAAQAGFPTSTRTTAGEPLSVTAGLVAGCAGFIGDEDGVAHLAGAVGVPGVAIWRPQFNHWKPPQPTMKFVEPSATYQDAAKALGI